ncbi:hypothetical protein GOP47_0012916 [Adiantum capillus-veneris]|uniref:Uncharacterized protein n=1 Tax=Adiantum capillus-veneris TaxID=13818 RepID=A0A9D4URK9_ADICA|nr:hypothetical protein GOP47_0012916 [Adiantum capillus-veneris]
MGNHLACMSPAASNRLHAAANSECRFIKFLNCETGTLSRLEGPLTAAEAMMEFPAQFVCSFSSAAASGSCGRRICGLSADEELQAAELYLLLPMHRRNTRFSMEEMAAFAKLEAAWKCSGRQVSKGAAISQSKVVPFPAPPASDAMQIASILGEGVFVNLKSRSVKQLEMASLHGPLQVGGVGSRQVMCRSKSWMPKLETVNEYAVAS